MWGLKNCMRDLVPEGKLKLTREDCLQMSEGMKIVLKHYNVEVEPEIVSLSPPSQCIYCFLLCYYLSILLNFCGPSILNFKWLLKYFDSNIFVSFFVFYC